MGNCSLRAVADSSRSSRRTITTTGKRSVEVLPPPGNGVWKVKLAIHPKDLERILSEDVNTEALIQQMRIAANSTPVRRKSSNEAISK